jgi:hypothetical protein
LIANRMNGAAAEIISAGFNSCTSGLA